MCRWNVYQLGQPCIDVSGGLFRASPHPLEAIIAQTAG
jgi:hypothetical protein